MEGSEIADAEEIIKYSSARFILPDGSVDGALFAPREADEGRSSVNRPLVFSSSLIEGVAKIRAVCRLTVRKSGRFVQANVGALRLAAHSLEQGLRVIVIADPLEATSHFPEDPSHALILGLPSQTIMADLLADSLAACVNQTYPAIE